MGLVLSYGFEPAAQRYPVVAWTSATCKCDANIFSSIVKSERNLQSWIATSS